VKILFQTSNTDFRKYAGEFLAGGTSCSQPFPAVFKLNITGTPMGLLNATAVIYRQSGVLGLFQGHSATLLRIFPYAGVKFMTYDWIESVRLASRVRS